jgi:hypothetical protein
MMKITSINGRLIRLVLLMASLFIIMACNENNGTNSSGVSSFEFVMGTGVYAPPDIPIPSKGIAITDSNFHSTIVRITDRNIDGYSGPGIENEYSRSDPENSNGSYIILRGNDGEWYLYSASTFAMIRHLTDITGGGEELEPRWDVDNPACFYYLYGCELRIYNVNTSVSALIHDFRTEFSQAEYISTKTEGDASLDRRYWCFLVEDANYSAIAVIVYDKTTNTIIGQKNNLPDAVNWVSMDISGNHCIIGYETQEAVSFSKDFSTSQVLPPGAAGHMDLALTEGGQDVMVYQSNATDWISMMDLDSGIETPLVEIPFSVNGDIGLHFSGNCSQTPGWVLVSTCGAKNPPAGQTHSWMDCQVFMVELKANPRIWRIAHTQAYTSLDFQQEQNYFAEAFAAINKAGTKVYFGSNWNDFTTDYTDAYQVVLPSNWVEYLP